MSGNAARGAAGAADPISPRALALGALRGLFRPGQASALPAAGLQAADVQIEAEAMAGYARLCGFSPDDAPLTYPHILAFPLQMRIMLSAGFPFPVMGLVHIYNRVRQHARLRTGDRLTLRVETGRLMAHERGQAFSLETTALRQGQVVWEGQSVYLRLGPPGSGDAAPQVAGAAADQAVEAWPISADLGRRYARVSGDANPIHTSALGARLFGFPRPIAHGMWVKARALAALTAGRPLERAEAEVSFRAPLLMPGEARLHLGPEGLERGFEVRGRQDGRVHLRGRLVLPASSPFSS